MGTTAQKINYAINATNDIAVGINNIGGNITQNTELADFKDELDKLYRQMPKVSQDGTSVSLTNTRKGKLLLTPKGNIEQNAEPNPDYPQDIKVVTGENNIIVRGKNIAYSYNYQSQTSQYRGLVDTIYELKAGKTYIISFDTDNSGLRVYRQGTSNTGMINPSEYSFICDGTRKSYTATAENDGKYTVIGFISRWSESDDTACSISNFMISESDNIYEPYIEPIKKEMNLGNIELAKIGDYSDIIFKNEKSSQYYDNTLTENAWYKKQIIKSKVYDENNNFQLGSASTNDYYIFQTDYGDDIRDSKQTGNIIICDNFEFSNTEGDYQREYVAINPNAYSYVRFHIASSRLSEKSVNAFKNWLETHNVLIYYILENPIYTQIADTTLISQLEELNSIIGQGGTVVVETESENENAQLIVNASALASFENS